MKRIYVILIVSFLLSPVFLGLESEQTGIPQSHYAKQSSIINMKSSSEVDQISTDIISSSKTISSVTITKPHQGYLYIFNREINLDSMSIIIYNLITRYFIKRRIF